MTSKVRTLIAGVVLVALVIGGSVLLLGPGDPEGDHRVFLFEYFTEGSVGAEIGVWEGDFSVKMLQEIRPSKLHLIDPWAFEKSEEYKEAWYGGEGGQQEMDARYEGVLSRFDDEIDAGTVVVHRQPSDVASGAFRDEYFDWVYIDGNHLYEFVKKDLELYYSKVKTGGYITGDDYVRTGWWEGGVKKALDEFLEKNQVELVELRSTQFVLKKGPPSFGGRVRAQFLKTRSDLRWISRRGRGFLSRMVGLS